MMCVPRAATVQIRLLGEMCLAAIATAQLSSISQLVHTCDYCYTAANLYHSGTFAQGAQKGRAAAQPLSFTARATIPVVPTTEDKDARDRHQLVTLLKTCKCHEDVFQYMLKELEVVSVCDFHGLVPEAAFETELVELIIRTWNPAEVSP